MTKHYLERVQATQCDACLFTDNKIVSDARKTEILKECKENNNHFQCHKATIKGEAATCRAFYDKCTNTAISTMFEENGLIEFVTIT